MLEVSFFGVRGSTPCSCDRTHRIGGNTSCVLVRGPEGDDPIVLDLGTGLRYLGEALLSVGDAETRDAETRDAETRDAPVVLGFDPTSKHFGGTALVTHLHWDHVQGIPFFVPLLRPEAQLRLVGPEQPGSNLRREIESFIRPPLFPVDLSILPCQIEFIEMSSGQLRCGSSKVTIAPVPHCGPTNGYRIDNAGASVVYIPDHQQPLDGSFTIADSVAELCDDADILIHDAQYDDAEFATKADWGHSTVSYAAEVARRCGVKRLVLFHHDPSHDDAWVARAVLDAQRAAGDHIEVIAASEGLQLRSTSAVPV